LEGEARVVLAPVSKAGRRDRVRVQLLHLPQLARCV